VPAYAKTPLILRWWGLFLGGITLFWLPVEDVTTTYLTILSLAWCAWLGVWTYWRGWLTPKKLRMVWLGVFAGLCVFPVEITFILFKAGLHAHGFLDFSIYQIGRLAALIPLWLILGGVSGTLAHLIPRSLS